MALLKICSSEYGVAIVLTTAINSNEKILLLIKSNKNYCVKIAFYMITKEYSLMAIAQPNNKYKKLFGF